MGSGGKDRKYMGSGWGISHTQGRMWGPQGDGV